VKLNDIILLQESLDKYDIKYREQLALVISRDDATELAIDMVQSGLFGDAFSVPNMPVDKYISGGIAYRLFTNNSFVCGIRIISE